MHLRLAGTNTFPTAFIFAPTARRCCTIAIMCRCIGAPATGFWLTQCHYSPSALDGGATTNYTATFTSAGIIPSVRDLGQKPYALKLPVAKRSLRNSSMEHRSGPIWLKPTLACLQAGFDRSPRILRARPKPNVKTIQKSPLDQKGDF